MAKYKEYVAENDKLEMIQVSLDQNRAAAEGWAVSDGLPWYTVVPEDVESSGLYPYKSTQFVPEYVLVAADGSFVKEGTSDEIFALAAKKTK